MSLDRRNHYRLSLGMLLYLEVGDIGRLQQVFEKLPVREDRR